MNERIAELIVANAGIDQYLRINNLEIVGLPESSGNESSEDEEGMTKEALNSLNAPNPITSDGIDISIRKVLTHTF